MFNNLPQGMKISISRSIKTAFEKYMSKINWDEKRYNFQDFVEEWKRYSEKNSSWFEQMDEQMKSNPEFHQQLLAKMNEMIEKIIETPPTDKQMEEIDFLIGQLGEDDVDYCCKAEANFLIEKLTLTLQKRNRGKEEMASEKNVKVAGIAHFQAFNEELPNKKYTNKEIEEIIKRAKREMNMYEVKHELNQGVPHMQYPVQ